MERPVMFVQSLLVLVVAIQAISACYCRNGTMHQAMCGRETVIMAAAVSEEHVGRNLKPIPAGAQPFFRKYKLYVHVIYKEGQFPLGDNDHIEMATPFHAKECGVVLEIGEEYHLSGDVPWKNGPLLVSRCSLVQRVPWFDIPRKELSAMNDLLTGQSHPKCREEELCIVFINGQMTLC